jgi:hypothetical protein
MIYHRYPLRSLIWDYGRAVLGLLIVLVPLLAGTPGDIFFVLLTALALLFMGYALRTLRLQFTAYEIRPDGIAVHGPIRRFQQWDKLSALRLRYYSTVRDRNRRDLKRGWLELTLAGPAGKTRIDSTVDGFEAILDAAAKAAKTHEIAMDETSEENFKAFHAETSDPTDNTGGGPAA